MANRFNAQLTQRANRPQRRRTSRCRSIIRTSPSFRKNLIPIFKVLKKAGFDELHAGLAASTAIDYVWGFVIEEQAGMAPPAFLSAVAQPGENPVFQNASEEHAYLSSVMDEYHKTTATKIFDWGLQAIITGLKATLAKINIIWKFSLRFYCAEKHRQGLNVDFV